MLRASGEVMLTIRSGGSFDVAVYKSPHEMVSDIVTKLDREALVALGGQIGRCIAAIDHPPKRTCNRHDDCDAADAAAHARGLVTDHCHDDCCEDCFGA